MFEGLTRNPSGFDPLARDINGVSCNETGLPSCIGTASDRLKLLFGEQSAPDNTMLEVSPASVTGLIEEDLFPFDDDQEEDSGDEGTGKETANVPGPEPELSDVEAWLEEGEPICLELSIREALLGELTPPTFPRDTLGKKVKSWFQTFAEKPRSASQSPQTDQAEAAAEHDVELVCYFRSHRGEKQPLEELFAQVKAERTDGQDKWLSIVVVENYLDPAKGAEGLDLGLVLGLITKAKQASLTKSERTQLVVAVCQALVPASFVTTHSALDDTVRLMQQAKTDTDFVVINAWLNPLNTVHLPQYLGFVRNKWVLRRQSNYLNSLAQMRANGISFHLVECDFCGFDLEANEIASVLVPYHWANPADGELRALTTLFSSEAAQLRDTLTVVQSRHLDVFSALGHSWLPFRTANIAFACLFGTGAAEDEELELAVLG